MNNTFDFSYFVPTPDTTANCALSRWNDSLIGLSDFLKAYMSSRQSLEFGFSRNLNIAELLNLAKPTVKDSDNKNDYVINYRKYGDIKANVCGFEIPIVDFLHPFLHRIWLYDVNRNIPFDTLYLNGYVCHVFNYNSNLTLDEKIEATIEAFQILRNDVANVMTDSEIAIYFNKNLSGDPRTRSEVLSMIDDVFTKIENMEDSAKNFIFGFKNKKDLDENLNTSQNLYFNDYISLSNTNISLYRDLSCYYALFGYPNTRNFKFNINRTELEYMLNKYIRPHGIDFVIEEANDSKISHNGLNKKQLLVYFKFTMTEKPTVTPFVSHDGTKVPLSKQDISLSCSYQSNQTGYTGMYWLGSYWDENEECPVYYDAEGNPQLMTLENNIDCMGGRDYTIWSSPVQKTENGYQFECCMPLAFYNEASDSYSNEYYATKAHDGVEIGQIMYRVPVVKRMRQNIEEAIVNTHLTKCLSDLVPATNENAEDDETVVLGGVVVDDFTDGLYPVAETQNIATENEYGEVKIVKVKDSDGNDNGVLDLMYHYSETGELSYNGMTMPEIGRAVDMITLFDTLKELSGGKSLNYQSFVVNGLNNQDVSIEAEAELNLRSNNHNLWLHAENGDIKTLSNSIKIQTSNPDDNPLFELYNDVDAQYLNIESPDCLNLTAPNDLEIESRTSSVSIRVNQSNFELSREYILSGRVTFGLRYAVMYNFSGTGASQRLTCSFDPYISDLGDNVILGLDVFNIELTSGYTTYYSKGGIKNNANEFEIVIKLKKLDDNSGYQIEMLKNNSFKDSLTRTINVSFSGGLLEFGRPNASYSYEENNPNIGCYVRFAILEKNQLVGLSSNNFNIKKTGCAYYSDVFRSTVGVSNAMICNTAICNTLVYNNILDLHTLGVFGVKDDFDVIDHIYKLEFNWNDPSALSYEQITIKAGDLIKNINMLPEELTLVVGKYTIIGKYNKLNFTFEDISPQVLDSFCCVVPLETVTMTNGQTEIIRAFIVKEGDFASS